METNKEMLSPRRGAAPVSRSDAAGRLSPRGDGAAASAKKAPAAAYVNGSRRSAGPAVGDAASKAARRPLIEAAAKGGKPVAAKQSRGGVVAEEVAGNRRAVGPPQQAAGNQEKEPQPALKLWELESDLAPADTGSTGAGRLPGEAPSALLPSPKSPGSTALFTTEPEAWGDKYSIMIVKANEEERLGLDVACVGASLIVQGVRAGLLEEWNRANPHMQVQAGDRIVEANGVAAEPNVMIEECKRRCRTAHLILQRQAPAGTPPSKQPPLAEAPALPAALEPSPSASALLAAVAAAGPSDSTTAAVALVEEERRKAVVRWGDVRPGRPPSPSPPPLVSEALSTEATPVKTAGAFFEERELPEPQTPVALKRAEPPRPLPVLPPTALSPLPTPSFGTNKALQDFEAEQRASTKDVAKRWERLRQLDVLRSQDGGNSPPVPVTLGLQPRMARPLRRSLGIIETYTTSSPPLSPRKGTKDSMQALLETMTTVSGDFSPRRGSNETTIQGGASTLLVGMLVENSLRARSPSQASSVVLAPAQGPAASPASSVRWELSPRQSPGVPPPLQPRGPPSPPLSYRSQAPALVAVVPTASALPPVPEVHHSVPVAPAPPAITAVPTAPGAPVIVGSSPSAPSAPGARGLSPPPGRQAERSPQRARRGSAGQVPAEPVAAQPPVAAAPPPMAHLQPPVAHVQPPVAPLQPAVVPLQPPMPMMAPPQPPIAPHQLSPPQPLIGPQLQPMSSRRQPVGMLQPSAVALQPPAAPTQRPPRSTFNPEAMFQSSLGSLGPDAAAMLTVQQLGPDKYVIDGRPVTMLLDGKGELLVREDGCDAFGKRGGVPVQTYLSQAANVALSLRGRPGNGAAAQALLAQQKAQFRAGGGRGAPGAGNMYAQLSQLSFDPVEGVSTTKIIAEMKDMPRTRTEAMRLACEQAEKRQAARAQALMAQSLSPPPPAGIMAPAAQRTSPSSAGGKR
eukprot:TRINITY_DN18456_c0_g1_i2.p1 TRINITY_DN18456_c0_g1~~TRINITY_DN18456_c0_g1_i2.p1  ORF type:complete len:968 (+),score=227.58 TRINITY_DN18456_c0_g1_i2:170-3073(+)